MLIEYFNILKIIFVIILFSIIIFVILQLVINFLNNKEWLKKFTIFKEQLSLDIFKPNTYKIWELFSIDDLSMLIEQTRYNLESLKKEIFAELYNYDVKWVQDIIDTNLLVREERVYKKIFEKYKNAIKSINNKVLYLKTELDAFKSIALTWLDKNNKIILDKFDEILSKQNQLLKLDLDIKKNLQEKKSLDQYLAMIEKNNKSQKTKNTIFTISLVFFLVIIIAVLILIAAQYSLIYSL